MSLNLDMPIYINRDLILDLYCILTTFQIFHNLKDIITSENMLETVEIYDNVDC